MSAKIYVPDTYLALSLDDLELLAAAMSEAVTPAGQDLHARLAKRIEDMTNPAQNDLWQEYAAVAREHYEDEGTYEFDEGTILVSESDEGAYVMGWFWVDKEDVGFEDEDEEEAA